jgi:outer membrane protein assembly factor BamB
MFKTVGLAVSLLVVTAMTPPIVTNAAGTAWTTAHFDPARSGNDVNDPELAGTPVSFWTSLTVDGRIYGEPLYLNGVVYVATQNNNVYAFDATNGHQLWSLSLGLTAVPLGDHNVANSGVRSANQAIGNGCGNVDPLGVTGTPVIDPTRGTAGTLFALAETWDGATDGSIEHQLVAVDLAGHTVSNHVNADPQGVGFNTGSTRALEQERGALALAGGHVIVPYGGLAGDCGNYHGFAVSLPEDLSTITGAFEVNAPTAGVNANNRAGGIRAAGGPAVDASGNVYVTTGNGFENRRRLEPAAISPARALTVSSGTQITTDRGGAMLRSLAGSWSTDRASQPAQPAPRCMSRAWMARSGIVQSSPAGPTTAASSTGESVRATSPRSRGTGPPAWRLHMICA